MIRSQDLSLLCLAGTHYFTSHQHLALTISSAGLALILLLLSFKDDLLLLAHLTHTIRILRLRLLDSLNILLRVLHGLLLRFECSRGWLRWIVLVALDLRLRTSFVQGVAVLELACQVLVVYGRWVLYRCLWGALTHMHASATVPLARETLDLSFNGLVNEMRVVLRVSSVLASVGAASPRHRLALIYTRCCILLPVAEVSRLGKRLTLIELMEVWCVLVDRL